MSTQLSCGTSLNYMRRVIFVRYRDRVLLFLTVQRVCHGILANPFKHFSV